MGERNRCQTVHIRCVKQSFQRDHGDVERSSGTRNSRCRLAACVPIGPNFEEELLRNRFFPELQSQVGHVLLVTRQVEGGNESLQRFDAVADPHAYYPKTYE